MIHEEIMYKMASLALEKEAKYGSKVKPGIKKLYAGYINSLKGYPEAKRNIKRDIVKYKNELRKHPHDQTLKWIINDSEVKLNDINRQSNIIRGATGAAALGGGYGTYRAVRKRPAE